LVPSGPAAGPDPRTAALVRVLSPSRSTNGGLAEAGFTDVQITLTHPVADGMHSAIIKARKPAAE
jgi:hypothetical protein